MDPSENPLTGLAAILAMPVDEIPRRPGRRIRPIVTQRPGQIKGTAARTGQKEVLWIVADRAFEFGRLVVGAEYNSARLRRILRRAHLPMEELAMDLAAARSPLKFRQLAANRWIVEHRYAEAAGIC